MIKGLIFVGMLPPDSHNSEERRFVEELASHVPTVRYLRGVGVKSLQLHHLTSLPARLVGATSPTSCDAVLWGSLLIFPFRTGLWWRWNVRWLTHQLRRISDGKPYEWILWTRFPSPELVAAMDALPFGRIVYEPIDSYAAAEDLSPAQRALIVQSERILTRRAAVITGAVSLAEKFRMASSGCHWLPFGLDLRQRSDGQGIDQAIGRPRIGVVGELDWRLDEGLLSAMAGKHPDWQLVLAGPRRRPWGEQLARLSNVHWLGQIPSSRVRPVIAGCDVTLVPYRLTDWTRTCLPVKVFEYLAEAKPVVATPLPELTLLKDVVSIVPADQFDAVITQAISQTNREVCERRRLASTRHTIQSRARAAARFLQGETALAPTA